MKMSIKRKTRARKAYAYRMLLSSKTSVTLRPATVSVVEQLSSDITRFFAGHCPISGANIQA